MKRKIFVALSTFAEYGDLPLKILKESGFQYVINSLGRRLCKEEVIRMGKESEGVIAGIETYDEFVFDNMPKLRCISRCGIGLDNISVNQAKKRGIEIRNTVDVVIQPVVELTVAMIFDLLRKLTYHTAQMKSRRWVKKAGNLLLGKKIGILGLGKIGKKVAEIMVKLGTDVYGTDLFPDKQWAKTHGVMILPIDKLLQISDILSINLSLIKNNNIKLGEDEIRSMKRGAIIVNTSRGNFIDESVLFNALKDGHLDGAALDVYSEEPYQGILCELDNVVLTPHIATLTKESRLQMEIEATNNLIRYLESDLVS